MDWYDYTTTLGEQRKVGVEEYVSVHGEVRSVTMEQGPSGMIIRDLVDPSRGARFDESSRRWIRFRKDVRR